MVTRSDPETKPVDGSDVVTSDLAGCASNTVNVEDAVLPVPPLVEETFPVVLAYVPPVAATTLTVILQLPLAAIVPPLKLIVPTPAVAVNVPPQVFVVERGVAFT